jgi:hypothetical protein
VRLTDEAAAVEMLLDGGDVALLAAARERASRTGVDLATCVMETMQRYAAHAADEEWITLIGLLNRSRNPCAICLKRAFAYVRQGSS